MPSTEEILSKRGGEAVKKIQDNIPNATGTSRASVRYEVTGGSGKITLSIIGGRAFFPALETGSKPSDKNPSPEYVVSIREWMEARGKKGSAFGLAKGILKRGSRLWQRGGRKDVYTNVKNETIELIAEDFRKESRQKLVDIMKA